MKRETVFRIFSDIPTITTDRLLLREINVGDSEDMFEYARQTKTTKYLTWSPHTNIGYTHDYLQYVSTRYSAGEFYDWAITLKSSGKMIGTCGFTKLNLTSDFAEVGYVVNPSYWGNGYAPEALEAVLDFGFNILKLERIEARHIAGNTASRRVMEKAGMTYEGTLRSSMLIKNEYKDICVFSILKNEV